jgi:hypothetical protein
MLRLIGLVVVIYKIAVINVKIFFVWSFLKFFKASKGNATWKDIGKLFDISIYSEFMTFYMLDKIPGYKRLLTRLHLEKEDGSEILIDIVMITQKGVYVIQPKDRQGEIKADQEQMQWIENHDGEHNKFYNPIWLNETYINLLAKTADISTEKFISVILFKADCQLKEIKNISKDVLVLKKENLIESLKSDLEKRNIVLSEDEVDALFKKLKSYIKLESIVEEEHFKNIEKKFVL